MNSQARRARARQETKKVENAIRKYRCVHCRGTASRRRRRVGTKLDVPLCETMRCLRAEWAAEDALSKAQGIQL